MELVNHVPHKIKKRILKKKDKAGNGEWSYCNYRYYQTMDIVKSIDLEGYRHLKNRLRLKHVLGQHTSNQAFTGMLMADFIWFDTPQLGKYWSEMDEQVLKHRYDNSRKAIKKSVGELF